MTTHEMSSVLEELLSLTSCATDSVVLQSHINEAFRKILNVPYVFMVPLLTFPESNEGLIQVINDRVLEKEIRFSVSKKNLNMK